MTSPIAFVEDKVPDLELVTRLLAESSAANHWTNFGPVWRRLKAHIERVLRLPAARSAVPSASGTHALNAAAALAARDGPKRWVVSSYGFRATVIGPFAGALAVDCDRRGLIDLAGISRLGEGSYDGIVAANPFGLLAGMGDVVGFARNAGKSLILDNAAGFDGFDRADHAGVFECLSFHHTKPYGFGEGGCLIVDRTLEAEAMSAMDFGYRWTRPGGQEALSNGKLSDPAAAFVLARQQAADAWVPGYRQQFDRIAGLGERLGFRLMVDRDLIGSGAHGNVPLLCADPVPVERLENPRLKLQKYYKPLGDGPVSRDLYARIVNVPCHPDVAALSDRELEDVLATIRARALAA